jgi:uncharacterized protein (DUF4415 family)
MKTRRTPPRKRAADVPYNPKNKKEVAAFWKGAIKHTGIAELRAKLAKRSRQAKAPEDHKEQIALRVDKDVLDWYRAQGAGWRARMNAVLKAYRDATI